MYSFSYLEPVCSAMSSSNCCLLRCIRIFQETGKVVWYSHLLKNFPQFVVIHTVKGFGIVNKVEIDVFLELSSFFHYPADVGNLVSGSSAFLNPAWTSGSSWFMKPSVENFEHYFASVWDECNCGVKSILWHCLSLGLEWKLTFSSPVSTFWFSLIFSLTNAI